LWTSFLRHLSSFATSATKCDKTAPSEFFFGRRHPQSKATNQVPLCLFSLVFLVLPRFGAGRPTHTARNKEKRKRKEIPIITCRTQTNQIKGISSHHVIHRGSRSRPRMLWSEEGGWGQEPAPHPIVVLVFLFPPTFFSFPFRNERGRPWRETRQTAPCRDRLTRWAVVRTFTTRQNPPHTDKIYKYDIR
jgi:hypothetical protein